MWKAVTCSQIPSRYHDLPPSSSAHDSSACERECRAVKHAFQRVQLHVAACGASTPSFFVTFPICACRSAARIHGLAIAGDIFPCAKRANRRD